MSRIALVTYLEDPALTSSDQRLADALNGNGHEAHPVAWDDPAADWQSFDAIVIRSTWDYTRRADEFGSWLDQVEASGANVLNSVPVVRWNMHKRYLLELQRAGIAIVPTEVLASPTQADIARVATQRGWSEVVLKNAIGAGARGVRIFRSPEFSDGEPLPTQDVLLQPLVTEIADGEWSLIFFGGEFSHAALKVPAPGDIRVQARYGGTTTIESPSEPLIEQGRAVLLAAAEVIGGAASDFLYARVDGVVVDGSFQLMELELIEPGLFLDLPGAEHAAAQFARALVDRTGAMSRAKG